MIRTKGEIKGKMYSGIRMALEFLQQCVLSAEMKGKVRNSEVSWVSLFLRSHLRDQMFIATISTRRRNPDIAEGTSTSGNSTAS